MSENKYFFRKKKFGWGWTPATWEGWLITLGYVAAVFVLALTEAETDIVQFLVSLFVLTALLIVITIKFGEPIWPFEKKDQDKN